MGPKYQACVSFHILKKFKYNCTTRTDCLIELKIKANILIVYVCFMWGFQEKASGHAINKEKEVRIAKLVTSKPKHQNLSCITMFLRNKAQNI